MSSASMKLEATQASPKRANSPGQAHQSAPETDSRIAAFHDGNVQQLPSLMLQRAIGNYGLGRIIEPKLEINEPGEQEADRVADQVMHMIDIPGGGIFGITSDGAKICGGGYAGCGIGLEHDKAALPGS
jgi:hypothetical protein